MGWAWCHRGNARSRRGDLEGAIADLEQSLAVEPRGPSSQMARRLLDEATRKRP
jgi:hypothetical protein